MALSRKHYNAVADIFRQREDYLTWLGENRDAPVAAAGEREYFPATTPDMIATRVKDTCEIAKDLANYFKEDNSRFEKSRFMWAAGCGEEG